jgi:RNA polymerase sigma-54 factor
MTLAQRLELRQSQSLVMTPQLQQAIKLLQLSNLELTTFVEQEVERNPLLERDESAEREPRADGETAPPPSDNAQIAATDTIISEGHAATERELDTDLTNVCSEDSRNELAGVSGVDPESLGGGWASLRGSGGQFDGQEGDLEDYLTHEKTLRDHLTEQLQVALHDPVDRIIGAYLIDMTDEAGYLRGELDQVAGKLNCPITTVERVLGTLQGFDPAGVFARTLKECLTIQLKERDRLDPIMLRLLDHLELVGRRDFGQLMRQINVDQEDLSDLIADVKRCNPKPGLQFGSEPVQPVIPDVFVRESSDGSWAVELNTETLPRVLVNARYYAQVAKGATGKDRAYLADCLNNANWLAKSLDQRARTILKVASEIVRQQDAFLAHGVQHLRPLNLRTIADAIEMHESTVSRVTANKYMATPRGVFELKYFFTSAIASVEGGEAHSAEAVRHRIKILIDAETCAEILSDDRIVELLREAGIDIARRTVAKYREALRIPSSVQRRRLKAEV